MVLGLMDKMPMLLRNALPTTPRDVRANLEKHGIAWANWDYKGGFGILGRGGQLDREFINVLLGR